MYWASEGDDLFSPLKLHLGTAGDYGMDMGGEVIINKRPDKQGWVNRLLTGNKESQTHK